MSATTAKAKKKQPAKKTKAKKPAAKTTKKRKTATKKKKAAPSGTYIETVGRRKTSTARIRMFEAAKKSKGIEIVVNDKPSHDYFPIAELERTIFAPFEKLKKSDSYYISVKVTGGGMRGQAEAVRHGIARALVKEDPETRKKLKRAGYLTRDPRMKERKKFGLKKARKAAQWSKR